MTNRERIAQIIWNEHLRQAGSSGGGIPTWMYHAADEICAAFGLADDVISEDAMRHISTKTQGH